jgi:hypothetical protein
MVALTPTRIAHNIAAFRLALVALAIRVGPAAKLQPVAFHDRLHGWSLFERRAAEQLRWSL